MRSRTARLPLAPLALLAAALLLAACQTAPIHTRTQRLHDTSSPPPVTSVPETRRAPSAYPEPLEAPRLTRRTFPRGEIYAGLSVEAIPGLGGSVGLGQVFARSPGVTWSFEMSAHVQTLDVDLAGNEGDGTWAQLRGGVKALFNPCGRGHPVARAGLTWLRAPVENDLIDNGDFFGAYLGLGYEFDLSQTLSTGPEVSVSFMTEEGAFRSGGPEIEIVPQIRWHLIWSF